MPAPPPPHIPVRAVPVARYLRNAELGIRPDGSLLPALGPQGRTQHDRPASRTGVPRSSELHGPTSLPSEEAAIPSSLPPGRFSQDEARDIMRKKILLIEPQPLTRQGLALTLDAEPDFTVTGQVCCADKALAAFEAADPDLVITAIDLADRTGMTLAQELLRIKPELRVLILSRHAEALCAERALRCGAHGYVVKQESADVVIQAARHILAGGYFVSHGVLDDLLKAIATRTQTLIPSPSDVLSEREMELFELIGQGLSTQDISGKMGLSVKTVESYRNRIKQKLNVTNLAELMRQAVMWLGPEHVCYSWKGCAAIIEEKVEAK